ncbi:hypothetical protein OE88DRAFT_1668677 [Heliocybe sulcata]|uniref:Secreted protein n=1 Tax=Heliocybe sulcata TaxID=5364 RepID=A0A5C3MMB8_9AGAM|nr:hypothetical protein OE88DRAFT_1668677 [Heliocybe sulcata]
MNSRQLSAGIDLLAIASSVIARVQCGPAHACKPNLVFVVPRAWDAPATLPDMLPRLVQYRTGSAQGPLKLGSWFMNVLMSPPQRLLLAIQLHVCGRVMCLNM